MNKSIIIYFLIIFLIVVGGILLVDTFINKCPGDGYIAGHFNLHIAEYKIRQVCSITDEGSFTYTIPRTILKDQHCEVNFTC